MIIRYLDPQGKGYSTDNSGSDGDFFNTLWRVVPV